MEQKHWKIRERTIITGSVPAFHWSAAANTKLLLCKYKYRNKNTNTNSQTSSWYPSQFSCIWLQQLGDTCPIEVDNLFVFQQSTYNQPSENLDLYNYISTRRYIDSTGKISTVEYFSFNEMMNHQRHHHLWLHRQTTVVLSPYRHAHKNLRRSVMKRRKEHLVQIWPIYLMPSDTALYLTF